MPSTQVMLCPLLAWLHLLQSQPSVFYPIFCRLRKSFNSTRYVLVWSGLNTLCEHHKPGYALYYRSNSWYWRIHAQCVDECSCCTISRTSLTRYYGRLCNLFNQIGVMLAPMILGSMLTATGSYKSALMTLAIAPVIGAVALFFVRLKK